MNCLSIYLSIWFLEPQSYELLTLFIFNSANQYEASNSFASLTLLEVADQIGKSHLL